MNKIGKLFIAVGILLIICSLSLLVYNNYEENEAGIKSEAALSVIKTNFNENVNIVNETNNLEEIKKMSTININGYDYIGSLTIPNLNLELPIMSEYDNKSLKIAPSRYYGSIYTDDLIICGHSYKTHFKYLSNLEQGDKVIFTDVNGKNYTYEVLEIEVLEPNDVDLMINNNFDLTLYTCTNDGLNRITIRCNRSTNKI